MSNGFYSQHPNVSVVIPAKNGGDLRGKFIRAIRHQNYDGKIETIIVDSGSSDSTVEFAHKFFDRVDCLKKISLPSKSYAQEFWALQDVSL